MTNARQHTGINAQTTDSDHSIGLHMFNAMHSLAAAYANGISLHRYHVSTCGTDIHVVNYNLLASHDTMRRLETEMLS